MTQFYSIDLQAVDFEKKLVLDCIAFWWMTFWTARTTSAGIKRFAVRNYRKGAQVIDAGQTNKNNR